MLTRQLVGHKSMAVASNDSVVLQFQENTEIGGNKFSLCSEDSSIACCLIVYDGCPFLECILFCYKLNFSLVMVAII